MDETIFIDADEEITAVIDKLKESTAKSVLLVVPKGASILQSIVNLKLLRKEAEAMSKDIGLVTADNVGRNLAAQVGLPVYEDAESRQPVVQPPRPERPPTEDVIEVDLSGREQPASTVAVHHYRGEAMAPAKKEFKWPSLKMPKRKALLGAGVFLIAIAALLFFFPKTTVVLGVQTEPYDAAISLTIDKKTTEVAEHSNILPGIELSIEREKATTATATGKSRVGLTKTSGSVTIYNCYSSAPFDLGSGTTFTSGGKEYVSTAAVNVPGGSFIGGSCTGAGTASVNIEAKAAGDEYNKDANAIFCISLSPYSSYCATSGASYIYAKNPSAYSNGTSADKITLQQSDIDAASDLAKDELVKEITEDIREQATDQNLVILDAALEQQVVDKSSDKTAGTETANAQVTTRVRVRTLAFKENDYRKLVVDLVTLRIPEGKQLVLSDSDETSTSVLEANWDEGFIKLEGEVRTKIADKIDEGQAKNLATNTSRTAAEAKLKELPGVVEVTVDTVPGFLGRTAVFGRNVTVKTEAR